MGKVHGSLARAGKVRNQTPKVDKQEKKKRPKGRAYKRVQARASPVAVPGAPPQPPLFVCAARAWAHAVAVARGGVLACWRARARATTTPSPLRVVRSTTAAS